jgi:hypothetical protein
MLDIVPNINNPQKIMKKFIVTRRYKMIDDKECDIIKYIKRPINVTGLEIETTIESEAFIFTNMNEYPGSVYYGLARISHGENRSGKYSFKQLCFDVI